MADDRLVATDAKKFRSQIRHILGNMHVGTSMAEVEAEMSRRVEKMRKQGADATAAFVRGIKRIAKAEHKKNQQLYQGVMTGTLGRRRNPRRNPRKSRLAQGFIPVRVTFDDGDSITTEIRATPAQARKYYMGKYFNLGAEEDRMVKAVKVEVLGGFSRAQNSKNPRKRNPKHPFTVTMRYVVSDDPYAPRSKKDVVAIRDGKEYARWPWHYRSKPRMGSKHVTINGIRFKTSWR